MLNNSEPSSTVPAPKGSPDLHDFLWHALAYFLANGIMVAQDLIGGDGLNWAYWSFIPWGIGLAVHGLAVLFTHDRSTVGTA